MDAEISERSWLVEELKSFERNGFFVAKAPISDDLLACGDIFGAKLRLRSIRTSSDAFHKTRCMSWVVTLATSSKL